MVKGLKTESMFHAAHSEIFILKFIFTDLLVLKKKKKKKLRCQALV